VVLALLVLWGRPLYALAIAGLVVLQLAFMRRLLAAPRERAPWYNATGVTAYVSGMLIAAFALRGIVALGP
jgi:chlorophyll synthase